MLPVEAVVHAPRRIIYIFMGTFLRTQKININFQLNVKRLFHVLRSKHVARAVKIKASLQSAHISHHQC